MKNKSTELYIQNLLVKYLKTIISKEDIVKDEVAHLSGSTDVVVYTDQGDVYIELKLLANERVLEQLKSQRLIANFLIAVVKKPKRKSVMKKWIEKAKVMNINMLFYDDGYNFSYNDLFVLSNPNFNQHYVNMVKSRQNLMGDIWHDSK